MTEAETYLRTAEKIMVRLRAANIKIDSLQDQFATVSTQRGFWEAKANARLEVNAELKAKLARTKAEVHSQDEALISLTDQLNAANHLIREYRGVAAMDKPAPITPQQVKP